MTKKPDIHRLIDLYKLILEFRNIERIIFIPGKGDLAENDVDHTFALALMAWYLAPNFPELNTGKVLELALAHDIVEVKSGDTSVFNKEKVASKVSREDQGRAELRYEWPDFPALHQNLQEYADRETPEAKFVYALDKIMPVMLNFIAEGYSWRKHKITLPQLHEIKKGKVDAHPAIGDCYQQLYKFLQDRPEFFHQPPSQQR